MSIARRGRVLRKSLRDAVAESQRAQAFWSPTGIARPVPKSIAAMIQPKRAMKPRAADGTYESDIQAEIIAFLRAHPKVKIVERHNSGTAVEQGANGGKRFIRYNTVFKVAGVRMRKVDIDCTLVNGRRFVVEVKRPPWTAPTDQREIEQENYIQHVRAATSYGLFATSVRQVSDALDAINLT